MHELKRSKKIQEELKIGDEILIINLDADSITREFRKKQIEIVKAEQSLNNLKKIGVTKDKFDDALEIYGNAIISLFKLVLGEENAVKVLEFYEDNYIEMAREVIPYITEVIYPHIQQAANDQKDKLKNKFNPNRSQRRKFGVF